MSVVPRIPRVEILWSGRDIMVQTRDGMLFILIRLENQEPRDLIATSDSISIDHSSLSLKCQ